MSRSVLAKIRPDPGCFEALARIQDDIAKILDSRVRIAPVSDVDRWSDSVWTGAMTLSGPDGLSPPLVDRAVRIIAGDVLHTLDMRADGMTYSSVGLDIAITLDSDGLTLAWKFATLTSEPLDDWD
jgi:hypothetical protein